MLAHQFVAIHWLGLRRHRRVFTSASSSDEGRDAGGGFKLGFDWRWIDLLNRRKDRPLSLGEGGAVDADERSFERGYPFDVSFAGRGFGFPFARRD
ncbi:MAG TPA: hypothetical protein VFJ57_00235 [Solirubrobacterales bacterium]|nr:hypothetical protein [Solirubrobacterales bacterium]